MKQILIMTTAICMLAGAAMAQKPVCKPTKNHKAECYTSPYNYNFHICREPRGYYVCNETPNRYNSTFQYFHLKNQDEEEEQYQLTPLNASKNDVPQNQVAPENQSYKNITLASR